MDFETMVRRGLGRAVLYAREHDVSRHHDFLLHACLHNLSYDSQADASRSHYMYDLLRANQDFASCPGELYKAAIAPSQEYDLYQIYEILGLLARDGDEEARLTLYQAVARDASIKQYDGPVLNSPLPSPPAGTVGNRNALPGKWVLSQNTDHFFGKRAFHQREESSWP